jgi:hypothetical protein
MFCLCSQPLYGSTETGVSFMGRAEDTLEQMTSTVGCLTDNTEVSLRRTFVCPSVGNYSHICKYLCK